MSAERVAGLTVSAVEMEMEVNRGSTLPLSSFSRSSSLLFLAKRGVDV